MLDKMKTTSLAEKKGAMDHGRYADDAHLRGVDLNLLTVFDVVMRVQNITRAAEVLGMSQPAVSNAVARLKVMFNDELFIRYGRGIQATHRACQLFDPIRQALLLVQNELPGAGFSPTTSGRIFNIAVQSPLDIRLTPGIFSQVKSQSQHIQLLMSTSVNADIDRALRYQEIDFLIDYHMLVGDEFISEALFDDEFVLAVAKDHPRIQQTINEQQFLTEQHAVVCLEQFSSLSKLYYGNNECGMHIAYSGTDMNSVLNLVAQTEMLAVAPKWMVDARAELRGLSLAALPDISVTQTCYLIWHRAAERDRGHQWMKLVLSEVVGERGRFMV